MSIVSNIPTNRKHDFYATAERPSSLLALPDKMPDVLKDLRIWINWDFELEKGKWKKVPKDPKNNSNARTNDSATWATKPEAIERMDAGTYEGIAIVLTRNRDLLPIDLVGIDLDDCRDKDTGEIDPWAMDIIKTMDTYCEVSPSGTGVKMICEATWPEESQQCGKNFSTQHIEIFREKYWCMTGHRLPGSPATIERRTTEVAALWDRVSSAEAAAKSEKKNGQSNHSNGSAFRLKTPAPATTSSEEERYAKYLLKCDESIQGNKPSGSNTLMATIRKFVERFKTDHDTTLRAIATYYNPARCIPPWSEKELRHAVGNIFKRGTPTTAGVNASNGRNADDYAGGDDGDGGDVCPPARNAKSKRAEIIIGTAEHAVNDAAIEALATDATIFQRGGILVRVLHDGSQASGIRRDRSAYIDALPSPILRDRLTAVIEWQSMRQKGDTEIIVPAHPPGWCVSALHARGHWPGIRHLEAVLDYPVLRPDGTILSASGYDGATGLLMDCHCEVSVPDRPTLDDAIRARDLLFSVVTDFPFAAPIHQSAWMAALLTPLSRFSYHGPAPLFLVDANVRGSGKGLLLDTISRIMTGGRFVIAAYTQDEDEMRKRITSLAVSGERLVLFDNLDGNFGNGTLDAALTGTSWTDRLLGVNKMARCPLFATWYATGNNVQVQADMARRICHIRLESPEERPEERAGFQHNDLLGYIGEHRAELLSAALTILRAYVEAGRPDQSLPAWGSFDAWSRIVRAAIVWAGMPDPGETRAKLQESADTTAESMGQLLGYWELLDPSGKGMTTGELIDKLRAVGVGASGPDIAGCRAAVEALIGKLDSRTLGYRLRRYRRRIFAGRYIDRAGESHNTTQWRVYPASSFSAPDLSRDMSPISPEEF